MEQATRDNTKMGRRPRPKQTGTLLGVRLQPPAMDALDAWIAAQPDPKPSRPEAIRQLIELGLKATRSQGGSARSHSTPSRQVDEIYENLERVSPKKPKAAAGGSRVSSKGV
jgi:hypothetical protein